MTHTLNQIVAAGLVLAGMLAATGCEPKRIPPMTVTDLMEDRVALDGVLLKCNHDPVKARDDSDCLIARIAVERLAKEADPIVAAKRTEEFERRRERWRQAQDRAREEQESKAKIDPYELPVVPVDRAPPGKDPASPAQDPTVANQAKP